MFDSIPFNELPMSWLVIVKCISKTFSTTCPTGASPQIDVDSTRYFVDTSKEKLNKFPCRYHVISTFLFNVISLVKKSALFPCTFSGVILLVEKFTLFAYIFFGEISMAKNSTWYLVSCKLMKTFEEVCPC